MLKIRVIPILLLRGSSIVKSVNFSEYRMVGDAVSAVKIFSQRMADEMVILDIDAREKGTIDYDLLARLAKDCNYPLSIGGGIDTLAKADRVFRSGADKIVLNTALFSDLGLLQEISYKYGAQAVVASIDVVREQSGYQILSSGGTKPEKTVLTEFLPLLERNGCGEVLINSIDLDGTMEGMDYELITLVSQSCSIPIVAAGGAGDKHHFVLAVESGASAVAAGSIFHWVGESLYTIRQHLDQHHIPVRRL